MPENVSLLIVGGNHTDTTLVQKLHQTMKDLHEQGVPVILAVENSKGVDVDRMIRYTAQISAELQVIAEGPLEGKTVGERVREKAAQLGVELKDPKPYFPHVVDYDKSNFGSNHGLGDFIARCQTYEAMCELYQFAKQEGIPLEGIDRTQEDVQKLEETGLKMNRHDPVTTLESFRIETMSNNLVDLMERMSKGNGGVILTPDLGAGHVGSLKTAVDGKVARSETLQNTNISVEAICCQQEGLSTSTMEETMISSARSIAKMDELYARVGIYPGGYLMDLAKQTVTNIEKQSIPIVPSNDIHSHLDTLLKEKLALQQENVRQLDDLPSETKVEVEGNNTGYRPGSVGSEILARGGVVRTPTGEKERQGRGYNQ
jgi:hypothetical protein